MSLRMLTAFPSLPQREKERVKGKALSSGQERISFSSTSSIAVDQGLENGDGALTKGPL